MASPPSPAHSWKFFRIGGIDQVTLETGADLIALETLDQKLWVALSCPVKGLELDEHTLALIDRDGDGFIQASEIIAAIKRSALVLKDVGVLLQGKDGLPLQAIDDGTPMGAAVLAAAKRILSSLGTPDASEVTVPACTNTSKIYAGSPLHGNGVITTRATNDEATTALIKDIIDCCGGDASLDRTDGVTAERVQAFFSALTAYIAWLDQGKEASVLGDETAGAYAALEAVRVKVDDYFARTRLAAFDARALPALNRSESDYLAIAAQDLKITSAEIEAFPLAMAAPGKPLPLEEAVNPAWASRLAAFHRAVVTPVYGPEKTSLTENEWQGLGAKLAPYQQWLAAKTGAEVEKLGAARAREILAGPGRDALDELFARDKALEPEFKAMEELTLLVRYHRDFRALLHSFVNFADFYARAPWATFQAGTLFLDSRSTELCIRVDGPNTLAAMSKIYIAYCALTRAGGKKMTIAACFTQGDSDYLAIGRHGLFYDRDGNAWNAVITSIVENPISIRQAFWQPYKKFTQMIEERVAKRAAEAEKASNARLADSASSVAAGDKSPPKKVEVGTVAAIGVAVAGGLSALTLVLGYLLQLRLWQYPLLLLGLILLISAPSMVLAWLKLRQRTLGPILDGNGWAINGRVKINVPFGTALTELPVKPPGSRVSLNDPYTDKAAIRNKRRAFFVVILLVLVAAAVWVRRDHNIRGHYFWEKTSGDASVPTNDASSDTSAGSTAAPAAP